jgi:magnesium transporter
MEILVYRKGSTKIEENFTVADLPELLKDESAVIWVDMEHPTEADERVLLDVFEFHPLTVEDCRENRHYPKIEEFEGYLYFIVHGVTADTSPDRFNTIELDGFLGRNYVITYHHEMFRSINEIKQQLRTTPVACQKGSPFLLHQILDHVVDYYSPVLDDFDDRIDRLEDDIFTLRRPNNQILAEIMDLKRSVLRLRRISGKQMDILHRMSRCSRATAPPPRSRSRPPWRRAPRSPCATWWPRATGISAAWCARGCASTPRPGSRRNGSWAIAPSQGDRESRSAATVP